MNPWELIATMIKDQGIKYVFGIGDTDFHLFSSKINGLNAINLRFEGSAPFMAMAYSRLSGMPGVCSGSSGPGAANLVSGVLEAYSGCVPLIVFAPSVSQDTEGMGDFQECNQRKIFEPITKWSARIPSADRIPWYVERALSIAMNGQPGPVFLEMPINVGGKITGGIKIETNSYNNFKPIQKYRTAGDSKFIKEGTELILNSKNPVVVAGNGTVISQANQELKEFIELLGIPFLTTPGGRGIISEEHPLALGLVGIYRTKLAKKHFNESDLVITVGSRNESFQTHGWKDFPQGAKFLQIDISSFEIGRNWKPDTAIVGDAKLVLRQLINNIKSIRPDNHNYLDSGRIKKLISQKAIYEKAVEEECLIQDEIPSAKYIIHKVSEVFGQNTIISNENGSQDTWSYCYPYYKVQEGSECIPVAEQTCMGMGVVGTIAAKLVRPEKKSICIVGDGAFQMYMKELPTASQYKAGCTWIVLNNSAFGWIKFNHNKYAGYEVSSFKIQPDFVKCAQASGCYGQKILKCSDVQPALENALKLNEKGIPVVLDFITGLDLSHFDNAL